MLALDNQIEAMIDSEETLVEDSKRRISEELSQQLIFGELGMIINVCGKAHHGRGQRPMGKGIQDSHINTQEGNYASELQTMNGSYTVKATFEQ